MNIALVFAGGVGSRMNSKAKPKQFLEIHGKAIIIQTIELFENHPEIDEIAVVCVADWIGFLKTLLEKANFKKVKWVVPGADSALASQYNGLKAIKASVKSGENPVVLIHDGVRPLINAVLISDCIRSVKERGSAVTISPVTETIATVDADGMLLSTIKRSDCRFARAPQAFFLDDVIGVHELAVKDGKYDYIDSASMMMSYGKKVYTVEGPAENLKVTTPSDFYTVRALLDAREDSQIYGI